MTIPFVPLHIHSDFSFLDGASQLEPMVDRIVELGMRAIALTDHGVMHGAIELIKLCLNKGIKAIIGNEMYVINGDIEDKTIKCRKYHQVVLALNKQGYENLVKLTTTSHLKGFMGKGIFARPCINKELLEKYNEGLLVTSACLGGEIPQAILADKIEHAYEVAQWYKRVFGDRFYLEIQDHGQTEERIVNPVLVQMSRDLDIELVATNDSHFISCYDVEAHDALLCIQTGKLVSDEKRMRYTGTEYIKSGEEMMMLFRDHLEKEVVEKAIANTVAIADRVTDDYDLFPDKPSEPTFPLPEGETPESYMRSWAEEGLKERLKKVPSNLHKKYKDRLNYEMNVLSEKGLCQYFLIVGDKIRWARSKGIPVGPGRGSAAGSVVAYAMKITNIDPIHHGLLFERFLNPERPSYPDIDTDYCVLRREEVIQYLTERYGRNHVAQIVTFNRLTSKAVIKDSGRVLDIPYKETESYSKEIPVVRGKPTKLSTMVSDESPVIEFRQRYKKDREFADLVNLGLRLEGVNKTSGVHAAGVVISAKPLDTIVPLMVSDGVVVSQYRDKDLEKLGLLKIDVLALKNLTTIDRTCKLVKKTQGKTLRPDDFPMNDAKVYQFYRSGGMDGIFQMESSGMRSTIRDIAPTCIDDISSILALYRPGPLDNGFVPKFVAGKHKGEIEPYADPRLEPILADTYGQMIYQEQIMKIFQVLAKYTSGEADSARRAMGKKSDEVMMQQKEPFVAGCVSNGVPQAIAEALFQKIFLFASYCFNMSHSMAYAYTSYQTAYLKTHYPVEFMAALLTDDKGNKDKLQKHLAGAIQMGITILPPDVNKSDMEFTPDGDSIRFGLSAIANVGDGVIEAILSARAEKTFDSFQDFCYRVRQLNSNFNKKAADSLVYSGAFDSIHPNRRELINSVEGVTAWAAGMAKDKQQKETLGQMSIFEALDIEEPGVDLIVPSLKPCLDFPLDEKLQLEKEFLQFYASGHPLQNAKKTIELYAAIPIAEINEKDEIDGVEYWTHPNDKLVRLVALLSELKPIVTKKGDPMVIIEAMEDLSGSCKGVIFPSTYTDIKPLISVNQRLLIYGKLGMNNDERQVVVSHAFPLNESKMLLINLTPQMAQQRQMGRMDDIMRPYQQPGGGMLTTPVVSQLGGKHVRFHPRFWVAQPEEVMWALRKEGFDAHVVKVEDDGCDRAEPLMTSSKAA